MKLHTKFAGVAAALLLVSGGASATVTTWDYTVNSIFSSSNIGQSNTTQLHWGDDGGYGQSSLTINNPTVKGQVNTYLGVTPPQTAPYLGNGTQLTHANNPIYNGNFTSAELKSTISLTPLNPAGSSLAPFSTNFTINFDETPNVSGQCPATSPKNNPCNDIFVLKSGMLNSQFQYDDGTGLDTYYINIFPTSGGVLSVLEDAACLAAGAAKGCIGFTTQEHQTTKLNFGFTISANPLVPDPTPSVPEPGSLALMGLGLMGLFARRRAQR